MGTQGFGAEQVRFFENSDQFSEELSRFSSSHCHSRQGNKFRESYSLIVTHEYRRMSDY